MTRRIKKAETLVHSQPPEATTRKERDDAENVLEKQAEGKDLMRLLKKTVQSEGDTTVCTFKETGPLAHTSTHRSQPSPTPDPTIPIDDARPMLHRM